MAEAAKIGQKASWKYHDDAATKTQI